MESHLGPQPLSDLRVIDLTHGIAGPYCTKLLADFGADVIKVERPGGGDYARSLGPFPGDTPHPEKSGIFLHLNTNKRSVVLDLKTPQGVQVIKDLVQAADLLVESFSPGVMERLGLGYEALSKINPELVMTSISNFGQTGPYRDYQGSELALYAMGGIMSRSGWPDRYPLKLGGNHVQYQAGNVAAMATMFAFYGAKYAGIGSQQVDISILETQLASFNSRMPTLTAYQYTGVRPPRMGPGAAALGFPSGYYPCQDGYVNVTGGGAFWPRTVALLGRPELLNDPRFATPLAQMNAEAKEEFETTIWLAWIMERTKLQVVEECQKYEILSGAVNSVDEVVDRNPQFEARGFWQEISHPEAGSFRYPGAPIYSPRGWWRIHRPAPLLGQHTQEVLQEVKARKQPGAGSRAGQGGAAAKHLPLEGVRVLDMTVVWAGPYGAMFLADMGAEVIRVESVNVFPNSTRGQMARPSKEVEAQRPIPTFPNRDPGPRPWNRQAMFNAHARNKYSMTVDLRTAEGKDIFRRLVEVSDVFVENNAVGTMERLGFTYDVLSQWNPQLIMISSTGMGRTGPWAHYRGFGLHFEALYGHASITGYPDMDVEGVPGSVAADAATGVTIGFATVMALHQRRKTGKGMFLDIGQGETFVPHLGELFMDYTINGRVPTRLGNRDPHLVQGAYPCAGQDEWIAISLGTIEQWRTLCRVMGRPELLQDKRFATFESLKAHHDEVDVIIRFWTVDQSNIGLFHILQQAGIAAGPVLNEPLAYADPHLKAREFFVEVTAPEVGTHRYPSTTFKNSKVPFLVRKPPVRLGEDNDYIYRQVLKLTEAEYDHLKALGQIGMDYAPNVP